MTRLQLLVLQQLFHAASAGRRIGAPGIAIRLGVAPAHVARTLAVLESAGLADGTRLTLAGLAVAVATRPPRARSFALAA
jgi:hypothetical protein